MIGIGDPAELRASEPEPAVLPNGLQVVAQRDDRFPLVSARLYVRAGSTMEEKDKAGISHLLEHMVFKGRGMAEGAAERIESVGGYINAATSFDYTMYMLDLPAEHLGLGLEVLRDMIFDVDIDPRELEREKKVVISELARGEDSPGSFLFKKTQGLVWKDTAYAAPIIGRRETLASITAEDIERHIARLYQPQSMVLVVCGDVTAGEVVGQARKCFGDLKNDRVIRPPVEDELLPGGEGPRLEKHAGPWNKVYVSYAFPLPGLDSEASTPLKVLGYMLGGDDTSLLYRRFKYELRLVDDISASAMIMRRTGALYVRAVLDASKVEKFWEELNRTVSGVTAETFDRKDLERAVTNIEDSLYSSKETLGGLASKLGYFQFFEGDVGAENNYLYSLRNVDLEQIGSMAEKHLRLEGLSSVMLVPEAEQAPDTESLADSSGKIWPKERKAAAKKVESRQAAGRGEVVELAGGRKLVLLPDHTLPYVSLRMAFTGGDKLLDADTQGLAAMTSDVLTHGVKSMNAAQYRDFLSARAASLSASAGRDVFVVSAKYPVRYEDDILGLFEETLRRPAFAQDEVERVRDEQAADIEQQEDRALGLAFRRMFPFLFPDSSYGYLHLGADEVLAGLGREEVVSFWDRQSSQPWVLAACGAFERERIVDMAKRLAEEAEKAEPGFPEPEWTGERKLELVLPGRSQTHLLAIFPVPGVPDADNPSIRLLKTALSGQGGVLFRELREKQGLGYSVTAMLWQTQYAGFLAFYIGTSPEEAPMALKGFEEIARSLGKEKISKEDLKRAANLIKGKYYREHQSLSSRSREAAGLELRGLPSDYNRELVGKAQKLDAEDLRKAAEKYLDWSRAYLVRIDPEG
jgi:zinc protease